MVLLLLGSVATSPAQQIPVNYDESKVGNYTLPDPLILEDGSRVRDAAIWYRQRRPDLLHLFEDNIYGRSPAQACDVSWNVFDVEKKALAGKAIRKQVTSIFRRTSKALRKTY